MEAVSVNLDGFFVNDSLISKESSTDSLISSLAISSMEAFKVDPVATKLYIKKLNFYEKEDAAKVAAVWQDVAKEKEEKAQTLVEKIQFRACGYIVSEVEDSLLSARYNEEAFVCLDEAGNEQGFLIAEMRLNEIYVEWLVTNPINIRSSLNDSEPLQVKGAGTTLLREMEELASKTNRARVALYPLQSAIPFYEKNGYTGTWAGGMEKKIVPLQLETVA